MSISTLVCLIILIPVEFQQNSYGFLWIPVDSTGIPLEWPDSCRNRWGTVKYCRDGSRPMIAKRDFKVEMNEDWVRAEPSSLSNKGAFGDSGKSWKSLCKAETAHVADPGGALAMRIETPFQKGLVLDAGRSRRTCVGLLRDGSNVMQPWVKWTAGLNFSPVPRVNSPQQRKPAQANFIAALKMAFFRMEQSPETAVSCWRIPSVMGSLGFQSLSP